MADQPAPPCPHREVRGRREWVCALPAGHGPDAGGHYLQVARVLTEQVTGH